MLWPSMLQYGSAEYGNQLSGFIKAEDFLTSWVTIKFLRKTYIKNEFLKEDKEELKGFFLYIEIIVS